MSKRVTEGVLSASMRMDGTEYMVLLESESGAKKWRIVRYMLGSEVGSWVGPDGFPVDIGSLVYFKELGTVTEEFYPTKPTPGPWRVNQQGHIVSDHPVQGGVRGTDDIEHYGGYLICETVARENKELIAAAPELAAKLMECLVWMANPLSRDSTMVSGELKSSVIDILKKVGAYE